MEQELTEITLALIKPDGVARGLTIECIRRILDSGLEITEKKKIWMERWNAEKFRAEIKEKHPRIFEALIDYMTEGPCIALLIEGENATEKLRKICGATNSKDAERGTIRGDYGDKSEDMKELYKKGKVIKNIIHSSGNLEEAKEEIEQIFGGRR
ncbi:MAG: nucleoside-diphosphate kinase [Nanoarchaeota archaeon]